MALLLQQLLLAVSFFFFLMYLNFCNFLFQDIMDVIAVMDTITEKDGTLEKGTGEVMVADTGAVMVVVDAEEEDAEVVMVVDVVEAVVEK